MSIYELLSWVGVACLISAHFMVSFGFSKRLTSLISATGGGISAVAAIGMGVGSVAALNIAWMIISLRGASVTELMSDSRLGWYLAALQAPVLVLAWIFDVQIVAWLGSAFYVGLWIAFSLGIVSRRQYVIACIVTALFLVPALISLTAYAFAFNETFGVAVGASGLIATQLRAKRALVKSQV